MKKNILVINEDEDLRFVISVILENSGYNVIVSDSLKTTENIIDIKPELIIVSDWLERQINDGYCQQLKSNPLTSTIPFIITSVDKEFEKYYGLYQADEFIRFPFEIQTMIQKVNSLI